MKSNNLRCLVAAFVELACSTSNFEIGDMVTKINMQAVSEASLVESVWSTSGLCCRNRVIINVLQLWMFYICVALVCDLCLTGLV